METFHLLHLAASWRSQSPYSRTDGPPPLTTNPVLPTLSPAPASQVTPVVLSGVGSSFVIRAAAAQMVFASRTSQDFITPAQVTELEAWTGRGVLDALSGFELAAEVCSMAFLLRLELTIFFQRLHPEEGTVWQL